MELVSASEIASWEYCSYSVYLGWKDADVSEDARRRMAAGTKAHHKHGVHADLARLLNKAAFAALLLAVLLGLVLFLSGAAWLQGPALPAEWGSVALGLVLAVAALLYLLSQGLAKKTRIPMGAKILASDTSQGRTQTLYDHARGLVGNPDYITREKGLLVAGEAKPGRRSQRLYESDRLQTVVYLMLMRANYGEEAATYGRVVYKEKAFEVELTPQLEHKVLAIADEIRAARRGAKVGRNHRTPPKCKGCKYKEHCPLSLV